MIWAVVTGSAFVAGVIQTVTGFGAGLILIIMLSSFFDMITAAAINGSICLALTAMLTWKYRKEIDLKLIALPVAFYAFTSSNIITFVKGIDLDYLAIFFGVFLIGLSAYFLFFASRIRLRPNLSTAIPCGILSGIFSGFFGVGGPVMGLYLITVTDRHEKYIGNLQLAFTTTNIVNIAARITQRIYTVDLIPLSLVGMASILFGSLAGAWISQKLNILLLKRIVYLFVGFSGVVTLIQHVF